jgi:hypothetical protein
VRLDLGEERIDERDDVEPEPMVAELLRPRPGGGGGSEASDVSERPRRIALREGDNPRVAFWLSWVYSRNSSDRRLGSRSLKYSRYLSFRVCWSW